MKVSIATAVTVSSLQKSRPSSVYNNGRMNEKTNNIRRKFILWPGILLLLALSACLRQQETITNPESDEDYELITLLPRDAIPAITNPQFLTAAEADEFYDPNELIIGVEFDGDARAYSIPLLSNHEIVNDTVGGEKIAVTW